ncbi:MAG: hypothetical protein V4622_00050 [Bacteroidota bacterium]
MKTSTILASLAPILSVILFISCESHEQKADKLIRNYKLNSQISEKHNATKTFALKTKKIEHVKNPLDKNIVLHDEWTYFKTEIDRRILDNETKIIEIKSKVKLSNKESKRLTNLENNNIELKSQLKKYEEEIKIKWESFKLEVNQNLSEIDLGLKDLSPIQLEK